ncbi:hypothetical protein ACJRO7_029759 [Eucalyptus globulus]|uniref:Beta-glucuronosyltransferase GlcAT14A n=1 Tax=Eucalyptus globulus TaxID=34317 RepID=A0ABD3JEI1_EUCGL
MQNPPPSPTATTATTAAAAAAKDHQSRTTLFIILAASFFSLLFIFSLSSSQPSPAPPRPDPFLFPNSQSHRRTAVFPTESGGGGGGGDSPPPPPSVAYFISGSAGHSGRILRLLHAAYHPKNHYLLHLDRFAPQADRDALALAVQSSPIFRAAQNVDVLGRADFAYPKGSSPISATLHGASILLRLAPRWDWFVNLNALDYPLVTQDDLLHILSYLPKDLNFVNHTSYIGWRESRKLRPIIVDPGLYLTEKTEMFYASQKRDLPDAFRLFSGSTFAILSRNFIEHCILGTDNLPRTLLMYLSNTPSSLSNYFPTILCNSHQFNHTVVNTNLQYTFNKSMKGEYPELDLNDFDNSIKSGAAFASSFPTDESVLDRIDREILGRYPDKVVPGGWCLGESRNDTCSIWGDADVLRPGPGARRLEKFLVSFLSNGTVLSQQCAVLD